MSTVKSKPATSPTRGLWRDGNRLAVHRSVNRLPDRCVKTSVVDQPLDRIEHVFQWSPVGTGVAVAAALVTGRSSAPLISATATTMPLSIAVSKSYLAPKRRANLISGLLVLAGILIAISALPIILLMQNSYPLTAIALGGVVGLAGIVVVAIGGALSMAKSEIILTAVHMSPELAWFDGAHPDFLNSLPELPASHSRAVGQPSRG